MYDGHTIYNKLLNACEGKQLRIPLTIGVTEATHMKQKCLLWKPGSNNPAVVNCAVASAAVPGIFAPRQVSPVGLAYDGGVKESTFAMQVVKNKIAQGEPVTLFYSGPWPGFRIDEGSDYRRIVNNWIDIVNVHGLEWIPKALGPEFRFKDGIFKFKHVTFIAPTGKMYASTGGTQSSGRLFYSPDSDFTRMLNKEGRDIARQYMDMIQKGLI